MCCWPDPASRNSLVCGSREKCSAASSSRILWMETPILSSSARVFGSMAKVMDGSGMCAALVKNRLGFVAQRFAGGGFFQFRDGADVAGVQFRHFGQLFALHHLNVLKAFRQRAIVIQQRGVIFQHAAHHFEIVDAPGKRIGQRFEHKQRKRLGIVVFPLDAIAFPARLLESDMRMLVGMRETRRR